MTEAEWLTCADPVKMLEFLEERLSHRRFQLFALACCRRIWHLLSHEDSRQAVDLYDEITEASTDAIDNDRIDTLSQNATAARWDFLNDPVAAFAASAAESLLAPLDSFGKCWRAKLVCKYTVLGLEGEQLRANGASEKKLKSWAKSCQNTYKPQRQHYLNAQATVSAFLSEICGNPFRPVTMDPAWLKWNDGTVPKMA